MRNVLTTLNFSTASNETHARNVSIIVILIFFSSFVAHPLDPVGLHVEHIIKTNVHLQGRNRYSSRASQTGHWVNDWRNYGHVLEGHL